MGKTQIPERALEPAPMAASTGYQYSTGWPTWWATGTHCAGNCRLGTGSLGSNTKEKDIGSGKIVRELRR
jgi:hypothetical protein